MEYEKFVKTIQKMVEVLSDSDIKVMTTEVCKNNGVKRKGIMMKKEGGNVAPTVYLEEFYSEFQRGKPLEEIAHTILEIYHHNCAKNSFQVDKFKDYQQMKSQIVYRIVNFDKNMENLKDSPYIQFMDLAIVLYVSFPVDGMTSGAVLIKNEHLDLWGITKEEALKQAAENTPKLMQPQIKKMEDTIRELFAIGAGEETEEFEIFMNEMRENEARIPMYVLTNEKNLYGAACMLYEGVLEMFAQELGEDIYILPSSVHEVILVPASISFPARELKEMVQEINATQIPKEEILSETVYKFSMKKRGFCMI